MQLQEQFPQLFSEWQQAGGIENAFRKHLLGLKAITAGPEDLRFLVTELKGATEQIALALEQYPFV